MPATVIPAATNSQPAFLLNQEQLQQIVNQMMLHRAQVPAGVQAAPVVAPVPVAQAVPGVAVQQQQVRVVQEQPQTPQAQIRRHNSNASATSTSVVRSSSGVSCSSVVARRLDFSENENDEGRDIVVSQRRRHKKFKKKRGVTTDEQMAITRIVTRPVLDELDRRFLAKPRSEMFRRRFRKERNADGSRTLKDFDESEELDGFDDFD